VVRAPDFVRPETFAIPLRDSLRTGWLVLSRLHDRRTQRLALAALDGRLLADIGHSRVSARQEADKPFWR
jgi:uncharacterized protein YjiS (DUF1127 family)